MNKIEILACDTDDLNMLQRVSRQTFYDTFAEDNTEKNMNEFLKTAYSNEQLLKEMEDVNSQFYIVKVDGDVAGYTKVNLQDNVFELERIYLDKNYQKSGLGKLLLDHAVSSAKLAHCDKIQLGVWEHNDNALAFYTKMGFHQTGQHVFKLGDDPQTDLIYTKDLEAK